MSEQTKEEIEAVASAIWEARREHWNTYRFDSDVSKLPPVLRDALMVEARAAINATRIIKRAAMSEQTKEPTQAGEVDERS